MVIAAIDLAYKKPVPIAIFSARGKLLKVKQVEIRGDLYHLSSDLLDIILPLGKSTIVVVETPLFINNMNTTYMMTRLHAMIEKGVRDAGMIFFGIHPKTWQKEILGPCKDTKKRSIEVAEAWLGKALGSDDIADSVNIGRYSFLRRKEILTAISGGKKFSEKDAQQRAKERKKLQPISEHIQNTAGGRVDISRDEPATSADVKRPE